MDSLQHQIALTLLPQVGPVTARTLVGHCGSASAVFQTSKKELLRIPGIGAAAVAGIHAPEVMRLAERELYFLDTHGISALFYTDSRYPARLQQCYDAPALIYFKGSSEKLLNAQRMLAIVGTRQPTEHGKALCADIIDGLQPLGVVVVSGLAYGIDVTAHRQCCALQMPNIGVLGHGLGSIYPYEHRSVAMKMAENGGLVSEYIHEAKPDREHFPMRNRIIAGMCDALLVVETAATGGSMISAHLAVRCERDVFAVPGRPGDPKSAGCNYLIRNNLARLVESPADIATAMRWDEAQQPRQTRLLLDMTPDERRVVELVRSRPEIQIDQLALTLDMPNGVLANLILQLEFQGMIRTLPGKRYVAL